MGRAPVNIAPAGGRALLHSRVLATALFVCLCAFTLSTGDGNVIPGFVISAAVLALAAVCFWPGVFERIDFPLPAVILAAMTIYGIVQTLFFPHKIVYNGWTGVLFWLTAAVITLLSAQFFRSMGEGARFRLLFIVFGTLVCLLDLLQQASQTTRYFWLIPSRYDVIFGPFAYWNNFAQFVELLLPVTLWRALGAGRADIRFVLCAAIQIGAVVASGSRAGTALIAIELFVLIAFAYAKNRSKTLLAGAGIAVALSVVFVYAAGFESLIAKLQQNDQLAVRRNIDRSSLAMIRTHPFAGWGLDTYVPVYRMFARYDDGTYVNRAHNDWLEWASDGGIFFSGAMLAVFAWSIRPAIRSGWGIGLIAVCLHALVDYPFARFGVCGWYFCLLGMLAARRKAIVRAL
ncbi:MAG TPA: O-antigen ligase family protein [Bryobacteraceae bacterium]|jgi:O-antigen ligase|nr:O-antigen ligase family protein [Bryobacteraceae bacterium]